MTRHLIASALLYFTAITAQAQEIDPWGPEGPPVMGQVTLTDGVQSTTWQTYDYSVGAFDASAWVTTNYDGAGPERLSIIGYRAPDQMADRFFLLAQIPGYSQTKVTVDIRIVDEDLDRPYMYGTTQMTIADFVRYVDDPRYGHLTGTGTALLCSEDEDTCIDVIFSIDTGIQFGS